MLRIVRIALFTALLVALVPLSATAATRMPIGFQDDPTFRWNEGAQLNLDRVADAGASVVRIQVNWSASVPTRPSRATNPFDKAYQLQDVDDLARNAQARGLQLMIAIWGTPKWANGGKGPNVPPTKLADLTNFARALADRYSGRHPGYPAVRYWSIWNEPNLQIFLTPQFNAKGKIVSPAAYAKLYKAGYAGIKKANKTALVAIGETSNQGRDHPAAGNIGDSTAPGTFARLLAQNKGLKFDAYAEHPYATRPNLPPTQKVRFPNVTMSQLAHFGDMLDEWFKRPVPIWITEYGYETKPGEPAGVSNSQQAAYMSRVIKQAKANPQVEMFLWFIFHDSKASLWQSGLFGITDAQKPSYNTFSSLAPTIRGETYTLVAGTRPTITVPVPKLASVTPVGSQIGITWRVFLGSKLDSVGQSSAPLKADGTVVFVPRMDPVAGKTYTLEMDANDISGNHALWTYSLVCPAAKATKPKAVKKK